jgi:HNH endonuclease
LKKEIVELVDARAGNYCETCGMPALESMALHHRKLRSRGGKDTASNLIKIHHSCHNLSSDSIHANPSKATEKGWMVSSWANPETEPFLKPDGSWVLLKLDGTTESV